VTVVDQQCACGQWFAPNSYRQVRCNACRFAPSEHPKAKVSEKDIPVIRARLKAKESASVIAGDYHVHRTNILHIGARRTWKHVS
jgi:hypothetical protein